MAISVTQNYYLDGAKIEHLGLAHKPAGQDPQNLGARAVSDVTQQAADAKNGAKTPAKKNHFARWFLIALSIVGIFVGASLSLSGVATANPLLNQVGMLVFTTFAGLAGKVIDKILSD